MFFFWDEFERSKKCMNVNGWRGPEMERSEDAKDRKLHPRKDRGEHGCHVASHSVILENVSKPTRQ